MTTTFAQLHTVGVPTKDVCALIGRARATHYRHLRSPVHGPAPARASPDNGQAFTPVEREAVLVLIYRFPRTASAPHPSPITLSPSL